LSTAFFRYLANGQNTSRIRFWRPSIRKESDFAQISKSTALIYSSTSHGRSCELSGWQRQRHAQTV